jgi:PAS domain S-box-containing protein
VPLELQGHRLPEHRGLAPDERVVVGGRLLGYSREKLVAMKSVADLTPPEWQKNESGIIAGQVRSKMPAIYRKEYLHRDGSRLPIEVYNHTIFDRAGRPLYFYAFVSDLSGRK